MLKTSEVAHALWKLHRSGSLVGLDRHLQVEALALARREAPMLMTADQRLQKLADRVLP